MNARELNEIFEKYGIGHVRLEKPFEDSDEIHAMVVDDNGDYLGSSDKWHFSSIGTPCGDKFLKPHKSSSSSIPGV